MSATARKRKDATETVRDPRDFYETPGWVTRAILPYLPIGYALDAGCGRGAIMRELLFAGYSVTGVELDDELAADAEDLLGETILHQSFLSLDEVVTAFSLIISNPPYGQAMEFVQHAILLADDTRATVAMLLRLNWLSSQKRATWMRANRPDVYVLPKRPSFTADGKTDATEYAWMLWGPGRGGRWDVLEVEGR